MADKIIGIEVAGLVYGIEDTETANVASQAKTTANKAATTAGEAAVAVSAQAEKIANIESNIGDNDISEIASNAEAALESATEASGEIELINTRVDKLTYNRFATPRFSLKNIKPEGIGNTPTISVPIQTRGSGITAVSGTDYIYNTFSLDFYDNAVVLTNFNALRRGAVPSPGDYFGTVGYGILYSKIEQLLKEAYPDRIEEIENYVTSHLERDAVPAAIYNPQSIVFHGEPGSECYTTQLINRGSSSQLYFTFTVAWDIVLFVKSQGIYNGSTYSESVDAPVRRTL